MEINITGVNFINVLITNFSYERPFWQLFLETFQPLAPKFCTKNASVNVDEIDGRLLKMKNCASRTPTIN